MKRLFFLIASFLLLTACQSQQVDETQPEVIPTFDFNYVPTETLPPVDVVGTETQVGYNIQGWS